MEVVNTEKKQLPNASTTLVLGILSLVLGCGTIGFILGIVGLVISKESKELYEQDPDAYIGYGTLNAGRVLCIIGIVFGGIGLMVALFWIIGITTLVGIFAGV
ncbi:MAG: hypothetical protein JW894_05445 [Bacteroidales bacterium]|nr:hypothetical protein [Bacteroidales bacterium]